MQMVDVYSSDKWAYAHRLFATPLERQSAGPRKGPRVSKEKSSHAEVSELFERWKTSNDRAAAERIVAAYTPLALKIAGTPSRLHYNDRLSAAFWGLFRALKNFDPSNGSFGPFARSWMQGELKTLYRKRENGAQRLSGWSAAAVSANPQLDPEQSSIVCEATLASAETDDEDHSDPFDSKTDYWGRSAVNPEDSLLRSERRAIETSAVAYARGFLNDRQRAILDARFSEEPRSLREIATDIGVSRERVRQLEAKAIAAVERPIARFLDEHTNIVRTRNVRVPRDLPQYRELIDRGLSPELAYTLLNSPPEPAVFRVGNKWYRSRPTPRPSFGGPTARTRTTSADIITLNSVREKPRPPRHFRNPFAVAA